MDEQKQSLWQSLTDWDKSPTLRITRRVSSWISFKRLEMRIDWLFDLDSRSWDYGTRLSIAKEISEINDERAIPLLIKALKIENGPSQAIMSALVNIGEPAIPHLVEMMKFYHSGYSLMFNRTTYTLEKIGFDKVGFDDRVLVFLLLGREDKIISMGNRAVPALIKALDYPVHSVKHAAASALGKIKDASSIPYLVGKLKSERKFDRDPAIDALMQMNFIGVVPDLLESLLNEDVKELKNVMLLWNRINRNNSLENLEFRSGRALKSILNRCISREEIDEYERRFDSACIELKKRYPEKFEKSEYLSFIINLKQKIAKKRDELAKQKDILLDDKPKAPRRWKIYQQMRRVKNG